MFFFFDDRQTVPTLADIIPDDLRAVGEAVYGHLWQRQLTDRIAELREGSGPIAPTAVYGWAAGGRPIPGYVAPMLARVLEDGEADLARRLKEVRALRRRVKDMPKPLVREPRGKKPAEPRLEN
ncbi:hypothetical protein [Methylobacterium frigidaeris]|uniref:Uncharacterized protein n=1 Tax=Methylobacterium frigidaeris TaxID=2038277 RepID=A0AA37HIP5_9HYPH|nr:hypothetical protein [Methylobacterium frigidaeris]GJD66463.1 hypothetical protein MPEAHAMD_6661 [Methylobacterium frigidaeris]